MNILEIGVKPISTVMAMICNTTNTLIGYGRTIEALTDKSNGMRCALISSAVIKMGVGPNLAKPHRTMYQGENYE